VAQTTLSAAEKRARTAIERQSVALQTQLVAGGLTTAAARAFLEALPTPEQLMPPLTLADMAAALGEPRTDWRTPTSVQT
jgi:hypothetical protein